MFSGNCDLWRRSGVSPMRRHSPVRPPLDSEAVDSDAAPLAAPPTGVHQVFVGNWPRELRELQLATLFSKQGLHVVQLNMFRSSYASGQSSFAFVELTSDGEVERAIDLLHGGKVLQHQIVVRRSNPRSRSDDTESQQSESLHPPPKMPRLELPGSPERLQRTITFGREPENGETERGASVCSSETPGKPPLVVISPGEVASSACPPHKAVCDHIRRRLHEPCEVVVANFPAGTSELQILTLFSRFSPLCVRIMVNRYSSAPNHFTYAYLTLPSRMAADEAVAAMEGAFCHGNRLVVERKTM